MEKIKKINPYLLYTIIFILLALIVFSSFIISKKSFIWNTDGYKQHYIFFEEFNEKLRSIFSGNSSISEFSWNSGLGLDVIGQYSYYILGDPFLYISLLFPTSKLEIAYIFLILLRIYCIGLSFLTYCRYHKKGKFGSIIGTLMYVFSGYVLYASLRHPFFSNALILFPLLLISIDKIFEKDNYKLFIFLTAISAISNYYFCYMLTILLFIYALTKYFAQYKQNGIKFLINKFAKIFMCYIIGILIAAIILLPTIYAFINSPRGSTRFTNYAVSYYAKLFLMDNTTPFWSKIYVPSLIILILPIALKCRKKSTENKTILLNLLIGLIILLLPFLGSIMNGFSFQYNRWSFGFVFFLAYSVVINLRSNLKYTRDELEHGMVYLIFYTLAALIPDSEARISALSSAGFAYIILILLFLRNSKKRQSKSAIIFKVLIFITVCCNICWFSWHLFVKSNYINEFISYGKIDKRFSTQYGHTKHFDEAIEYIKENDNSFYRIGTSLYAASNLSLKYNYNSLNEYLSVGNGYINNLSKDLLVLKNTKTNPLYELDSRVQITTLLGSKYYVVSKQNSNYVPYGYKLIKKLGKGKNDAYIYENKNYLPIGVFYNNYTLKSDYTKLSPIVKEQALLKTAVIDNSDLITNYNIQTSTSYSENSSRNVKYTIIDQNKIINNKKIKISENNNSFDIKFNEVKNCELYLYIENLNFSSHKEYEVTALYGKTVKTQKVRDKISDAYYEPTPNILMNLGYQKNHKGTITVTFSANGTYSYDNIKVIAIPIQNYENNVKSLKKYPFELTEYTDNSLKGTIYNKENGILQISTPFSNGWTAYVDGKKTDIIRVNTAFIGIPLNSGIHTVELVYSTPLLKAGIVLSIVGILLFVIILIHKKEK